MSTLLTLLDSEIEEVRWGMTYYWRKGDHAEARRAFQELKGMRRMRRLAQVYLAARERIAA
jgi:hypothetical protein